MSVQVFRWKIDEKTKKEKGEVKVFQGLNKVLNAQEKVAV